MMSPPIEILLDRAQSKFSLVALAAKRARQVNTYFSKSGDGLGTIVPPQIAANGRKPLSVAFEEIAAGKVLLGTPLPQEEEGAEVSDAAEVAEVPEAAEVVEESPAEVPASEPTEA